jgi:hypothetical protein
MTTNPRSGPQTHDGVCVQGDGSRQRPASPLRGVLVMRDESVPPPTVDGELARAIAGADRLGGPLQAGEIPVVVPAEVLGEIETLTIQAGGLETGGALVGHLVRDTCSGGVYVDINGALPARHTEASAVHLAFTADTWQDLRERLAARNRHELLVGWFHSHPLATWLAVGTGADRQPEGEPEAIAAALADCFSDDDQILHQAVFGAAHHAAIVATTLTTGMVAFSAWGWRGGFIQPKGLFVSPCRRREPA